MQNADYRAALNTSLRMKSIKSVSGVRGPSTPIYYWLLGEKQIALDKFKVLMREMPPEVFEKKREEFKKDLEEGSPVEQEMNTALDEIIEAYNTSLEEGDGE